jgi:hypothetical protein
MAIKINGTTVIDDSRALSNIASVDATTVAALSAALPAGVAPSALAVGAVTYGRPSTGNSYVAGDTVSSINHRIYGLANAVALYRSSSGIWYNSGGTPPVASGTWRALSSSKMNTYQGWNDVFISLWLRVA